MFQDVVDGDLVQEILVLGWAPPEKEDVDEHVVVDGDLVQKDLST